MSKVIKVFGHPGSTCTRRVLTTLEELGLKYEIVIIDLSKVRTAGHLISTSITSSHAAPG